MKNKSFPTDSIISLLLIFLTVLFYNPFQALWMPTMFMSMVLLGFILVFLVFAVFVWREHPQDEREELHRSFAGRAGYLAGAGLLVVAIIVQSLQHTLDPWLLIILVAMIVAKFVGRVFAGRYR